MGMLVRLGGAWQTITKAKIFASGSWRDIVAAKIYAGGAWVDAANFTPSGSGGGGSGTLSLSVSPNPCQGTSTGSTVTTSYCTVTPSGGKAPFTYAWSITSGSCSINYPTQAFTSFTKTGVALHTEADAVAKCVVTDSLGATASITVDLQFFHEDAGTA